MAFKVSNPDFSQRFERQARAVAALNRPHICQLYDVGPNYLVMEFVEGAPLEGGLALDVVLQYAAQDRFWLDSRPVHKPTLAAGQYRAICHSMHGKFGILGNVESAAYRAVKGV